MTDEMVTEGESAPDFTVDGAENGEIRQFTLSEATADRPAVLSFYIYDFSPVCSDQMCEIRDMEFFTLDDELAVFGVSTDGPYSHRRFAAEQDISFPLLSDDDKEIFEQYGMTGPKDGGNVTPRRGVVVVDTEQVVRYRWIAEDNWDEWEVTPLVEASNVIREL